MTWSPECVGGCEAAKIAPLVVQYLQGRCIDVGSGPGSVWPQVAGIDPAHNHGEPVTSWMMDGTNLCTFADESLDGVFSSYFLHELEPSKVPAALDEWWRVLKVGGYLIHYLPDKSLAPKLGRWEPDRQLMINIMMNVDGNEWTMIEDEVRGEGDEYSLFQVYRKEKDGHDRKIDLWQRNPDGKKRCLIIRYGAIGDAIVAASILPHLKAQGYHITFNTQPRCQDVLLHDPNIDEWLIQENDFVPNAALGPFWAGISKRYDRVINLSESVEGALLLMPGRMAHTYSAEARRAIYDPINYLEHTHNIAAVPHDFSGSRFYPTEGEDKWARAVRSRMDGPVIAWCVNGSATHKIYTKTQVVIAWLLERTPAHIVLYGDPLIGAVLAEAIIKTLKQDGIDTSRVTSVGRFWKIRQSLAFARHVDVMVGPETGPMNCMAMEDVPKVIYLSHSSPDNLTKHWRNTTTLEAPADKVPCFRCHQLHSSWAYCFKDEPSEGALCVAHIYPEVVFKAIAVHIGAQIKEAAD